MSSAPLITAHLDAIGRLYTVLNGQLETVLANVPDSSNPISDLNGDGTRPRVDVPLYRFGFGPGPVPANGVAVAHLHRVDTGVGTYASGGPTTFEQVSRPLILGCYLQVSFAPVQAESFPIVGGRTLTGQEMSKWYRAEIYAAALDYCVMRYLSDGTNVREPITTVLNTISEKTGEGDIGEHIAVELQWEVFQNVTMPDNLYDV